MTKTKTKLEIIPLHSQVHITALDKAGRIMGVMVNDHGIRYDVRYFLNEKPEHCYLYDDEFKFTPEPRRKIMQGLTEVPAAPAKTTRKK
jgi:hypothetical protein